MIASLADNQRLNDAVSLNGVGEFPNPIRVKNCAGLKRVWFDLRNEQAGDLRAGSWRFRCRSLGINWLCGPGGQECGQALTQCSALFRPVHEPVSPLRAEYSFPRRES